MEPNPWISLIPENRFIYVCGVAQWITDLFAKVGYLRTAEYDKNFFTKCLYHLRTITFISSHFVILMVLEIAAMIVFWGQIDRVLGAAFIFSANMCHVVKLSNFLANRDEFVSLLNYYVDSLTKRNLKDSSVVDIIVAFEKISFRDLLAVMIWTCFAVISLALIGDLMDPSGLPLIAYYPFEIQYFPMFQLVYLHQMVAVMTAATFNVILDILSTNMVIQMCCQFRLLKRDIILIQELDSVKDDGAIAKRLREVIVRHSVLKTKCNELSSIFGVPILGQFLGSIFIICIGFFQFYRASDTGTDILTVIATITTILWALLQAFFYCHHGNELKIESESVAEVLAALPWYTFSPKNKRLVLLMIHAGQQPAIIKAAGLVHVTLAALMTIVKTSYSAFTVIANMDTRK